MAKKHPMANSMKFTYSVPAIRAVQAGQAYYIAAVPFGVLLKLLNLRVGADNEVAIDRERSKAIADYVCQNQNSYVLPPITLSVDVECLFTPHDATELRISTGTLKLPMNASFQVHDGRYRVSAIAQSIAKQPKLAEETIAVVIYTSDSDVERRFGDIKANQRKSGRSERIVNDPGDSIAKITRAVIAEVPVFNNAIEMVKTTISNRSHKLFTFSALYQANEILLWSQRGVPAEQQIEFALKFWKIIQTAMPAWTSSVPRVELRQQTVHAHSVTLCAIAKAGVMVIAKFPKSWERKLLKLEAIDWSRANTKLWEGKAMFNGRMIKSAASVEQTANVIYKLL